jgi:protein associated with RNAse G/E
LNSNEKIVRINARKFDGEIHRFWNCKIVDRKDSLLTFVGEFDQEVVHTDLGIIRRGTLSYEFYWLDRWYNVFRFHEPDGSLRNFYCNVNAPPVFADGILDYVDLDIDVLVWKDFKYKVLDLEEFEANCLRYNYSAMVIEKARKSLDELINMINKRLFPFDFVEKEP